MIILISIFFLLEAIAALIFRPFWVICNLLQSKRDNSEKHNNMTISRKEIIIKTSHFYNFYFAGKTFTLFWVVMSSSVILFLQGLFKFNLFIYLWPYSFIVYGLFSLVTWYFYDDYFLNRKKFEAKLKSIKSTRNKIFISILGLTVFFISFYVLYLTAVFADSRGGF